MKLTYKKRIFSYFLIIFALFSILIVIFEQEKEKSQRIGFLEDRLNGYAIFIHSYIEQNSLTDSSLYKLQSIADAMPMEIRVTIIKEDGKVTFDKNIKDVDKLENHLSRPEMRNASYQTTGTNLRISASTNIEYLYFARRYDGYYIRVALPYHEKAQSLLANDYLFIYIVIVLFAIVLILLNYVSNRFGKSILKLRNLAQEIEEDKTLPEKIEFPDDELGEIGNHLLSLLKQRERNKYELEQEREKLIQHFYYSQEGICFFNKDLKKLYANTTFFQYFNFIVDQLAFNLDSITEEKIFSPVFEFISNRNKSDNYYSYQIDNNGKIFQIQTIVFEDSSFEVTIKDVTLQEKTRLLKQEMTNNIAHELRTPVTSLRGYLETLDTQNLNPEKQAQFIDRAYQQSVRLSNLIEDISLISKMEEASINFQLEKVNMSQLIEELRIDMTDKLVENSIELKANMREGLVINGNYTLLYSIFRNMFDNTITYAGQDIEIGIDNYMENDEHVYFVYYDTGKGVSEQYLGRLFERFYRGDEGRTRNAGGSGLGLSIVRNAVLFHKGEIQVKNRVGGGLEFLFSLKK